MTAPHQKKIMQINPNEQSFLDHLDELRGRLIKVIAVVIFSAFASYMFIDEILAFIIKPVGQLVFTSPQDAFMARITLSLFCGFFLSLPYSIFQIWVFVSTGLKNNERKYALVYGPMSVMMFFLGVLFSYFVMIPISMNFLLSYATESMVPMITVKSYISFVGTMSLAFGVVFELPLVLVFLTRIGIATPEFLIQKRRHAIMIILIVSALITPPDVITQIIMAVPLIILYEVGLLFSKMAYASRKTVNHVS